MGVGIGFVELLIILGLAAVAIGVLVILFSRKREE